MNEPEAPPAAKPEPLFTLELHGNGGTLQPSTVEEALAWVQQEQACWAWIMERSYGNHEQSLRHAASQLNTALSHGHRALHFKDPNPQQFTTEIDGLRSRLEEAFIQRKLPHSSTPLAKRIEAYRQEAGDQAASFFAAVFVPPDQGHHFQPRDLGDWRAMVEALVDRFRLASTVNDSRMQAAEHSFELLRAKTEALCGEKAAACDSLHREYSALAEAVRGTAEAQSSAFDAAQSKREEDFDTLVAQHEQAMETLRKTFREEIALRAPVDYWETKRKSHLVLSWVTGVFSFAAIGVAAAGLCRLIYSLLNETPTGTQPDSWRIVMVLLIGVFALWGARLIVRMFLSHLHLLSDAAERVVMVKTYLSLMEGERLPNSDDRQLILRALFRPATDGIVKDEGIPPSMFEFLTRQSKG